MPRQRFTFTGAVSQAAISAAIGSACEASISTTSIRSLINCPASSFAAETRSPSGGAVQVVICWRVSSTMVWLPRLMLAGR